MQGLRFHGKIAERIPRIDEMKKKGEDEKEITGGDGTRTRDP
jgi:hypothetical protein